MSQHKEENRDTNSAKTRRFTTQDFIRLILPNWYWYLASLIICLSGAVLYLKTTPPQYLRTATVLVKDSRKGSGTEVTAFSDIMGGIGRRSVDNEIHIFKSRRLMESVVKRYDLTTEYTIEERLRTTDIYGRSPMLVKFTDEHNDAVGSFKYRVDRDGNVLLSGFNDDESFSALVAPGDTIATPLGNISLIATPYANDLSEVTVSKRALNNVVEAYRSKLKCEIADKQASIINISMTDEVPRRAEDVINGIIDAYNLDAIGDKQEISRLTEQFINERLVSLSEELNLADEEVADYKKDNHLYNPATEATMSAEEIQQLKNNALSLEANLEMAKYIHSYVTEGDDDMRLIPASTALASGASNILTSQIEAYNSHLLEYQRLASVEHSNNPMLVELRAQLIAMRATIISSLDSHIATLNLQIEQVNREQMKADNRIEGSPHKERELQSIVRQQKVKEELYIYLLTKLEENALTGATAESNARVIDTAYGSDKPVSPRRMYIYAIALLVALLVPFAILYILEMLNTKVRSRRDIEEVVTAPFLGDIPYHSGKHERGNVVREESRDAVSEAFRMLRANLSFMAISESVKVIMATSSIPHSGKTFISTNLAATLAATDKSVVLVDLDLRRRTLSKQMGHRNDRRGVTSYLTNTIGSLNDVIIKDEIEGVDTIFSGPQPPNPTEMLMSKRMKEFIEELRARYDYVIIDSVPAMAVADAVVIDSLVDLTLYVIRDGNLDRNQLPDIERLHKEKRIHNMGVVFNGVKQSKHGYGYGYGYGYYSDEELSPAKMRIKRFLSLFKKH
ncbi:MAG: polysaccharide biosynthesis tyrosine autokinase [Alistipes sp.]|nr:polysaccharide biosynthesis tyrosine autokinase [Alistipes sp.]